MPKTLVEIVESYDFRVVTREEFIVAANKPVGLDDRAADYMHYSYVIYDPIDDSDGFMVWGDDPDTLCREAISHYEMKE